jgi:hypothetical protein
MDNRDVMELRRVLRRHEEQTQSNRASLFSITTKVYENEHHSALKCHEFVGATEEMAGHLGSRM